MLYQCFKHAKHAASVCKIQRTQIAQGFFKTSLISKTCARAKKIYLLVRGDIYYSFLEIRFLPHSLSGEKDKLDIYIIRTKSGL